MKTKYFILFGLIITTIGLYIVRTKGDDVDIKDPLPLKIWENKNDTKPILFYLSGDAGLGPFSKSICKNLHQNLCLPAHCTGEPRSSVFPAANSFFPPIPPAYWQI